MCRKVSQQHFADGRFEACAAWTREPLYLDETASEASLRYRVLSCCDRAQGRARHALAWARSAHAQDPCAQSCFLLFRGLVDEQRATHAMGDASVEGDAGAPLRVVTVAASGAGPCAADRGVELAPPAFAASVRQVRLDDAAAACVCVCREVEPHTVAGRCFTGRGAARSSTGLCARVHRSVHPRCDPGTRSVASHSCVVCRATAAALLDVCVRCQRCVGHQATLETRRHRSHTAVPVPRSQAAVASRCQLPSVACCTQCMHRQPWSCCCQAHRACSPDGAKPAIPTRLTFAQQLLSWRLPCGGGTPSFDTGTARV